MSFMTPILMVPSVYCACAAGHPRATASAVRLINRFIWHSPLRRLRTLESNSNPQIVMKLFDIGVEFRIGELVDDPAMFHHVIAIRNRRGETKVLLDQEDGEALRLQHADGLADLLDDDRGQSLGRLVEQEKPRAGAQDAADRQHLLLAARELGALARQALFEIGEELEDAVELEAAGADLGREQKVFFHAEARENAAFLGT